jgi:hypothetical protein
LNDLAVVVYECELGIDRADIDAEVVTHCAVQNYSRVWALREGTYALS